MNTKAEAVGVESARSRLPELVTAAERDGRTTVISRRGRPAAALVPLSAISPPRSASRAAATALLALADAAAGKGLWGRDSRAQLADLRAEWG
jgi:prevent-host-death family protein